MKGKIPILYTLKSQPQNTFYRAILLFKPEIRKFSRFMPIDIYGNLSKLMEIYCNNKFQRISFGGNFGGAEHISINFNFKNGGLL